MKLFRIILLSLSLCSIASAANLTGYWQSTYDDNFLEFSESSFSGVLHLQKYSSLEIPKGSYEILDNALLLDTGESALVFDIRKHTEDTLILSAGVYGLIFKKVDDKEAALLKKLLGQKIIKEKITMNLRQVASAGQQYILENGKSEVGYKKLVGEYFSKIEPVAGESYDDLVVSENGGALVVTDSEGNHIAFRY